MQRGLMINELDHRYREDVYIFPMEAMELEALQLASATTKTQAKPCFFKEEGRVIHKLQENSI